MEDLDILTLAEAAALLELSPSTLRAQVVNGRLKGRKIGKTWVTSRAEVDRYRRSNLGRPGRPELAEVVTEIPWTSNMYEGVNALRIAAFPDSPPADVDAVAELARKRIDEGAWTMAEVLTPLLTRDDLPFHWSDSPPTITVVRIHRNLLEQTKAPFEDVTGRPGEPNILRDQPKRR